jgi:hypothetical protein
MTRAAAWLGIAGHMVEPHMLTIGLASPEVDESSADASPLAFEPDDEQLHVPASRARGPNAENKMAESRSEKDGCLMTGTSLVTPRRSERSPGRLTHLLPAAINNFC